MEHAAPRHKESYLKQAKGYYGKLVARGYFALRLQAPAG